VEYCRFGNLQTFLINHRNKFVNQLDEFGNMKLCCNNEDNAAENISYFAEVERKDSEMNGRTNGSYANSKFSK
jgi:hypothetical protein